MHKPQDVTQKAPQKESGLHAVGGKRPLPRSHALSPKHLRISQQRLAVASFRQHQDAADAARSLEMPGVTAKTIHETFSLSLDRRIEELERAFGQKRAA
jgi:hypothetical protein